MVGWLRSGDPLAHLLEEGFTISAMLIESAKVMAFEWAGVGEVFAHEVHRPATDVRAYPSILPSFEAREAEIEAALLRVAQRASAR